MLTYWETLIAKKSNINVNDSYAALWGKKPQSGYTVETYTGTLPATLQTIEGYLESYKIYGNAVQDGTPTPENPIVPSGCGERTGNLFDGNSTISGMSSPVRTTFNTLAANIDFKPNTQYSLCIKTDTMSKVGVFRVTFTYSDGTTDKTGYITKNVSSVSLTSNTEKTVTSLSITDYNAYVNITLSEITVIEGSTPPDTYIPYGYKLPLTANGVEYPIYLGESQTTRKIKKLVLTGGETWRAQYNGYTLPLSKKGGQYTILCTHYKPTGSTVTDKSIYAFSTDVIIIWDNNYTTLDDFKSYLASQYAAGTPVTIWYVLAEPETTVVNEPLMKIGDYADTIDSTQSTVQIPTTAGSTTISWAGEGLAPSQVELEYEKKR